ncbi:MAG TPA: hypothetical protein V6C96_01170 [Vampirovibrionales bacterium]
MSSVSGGNMPTGGPNSAGLQMGNLGGDPQGGGNFFMGGEDSDFGGQQGSQSGNSELMYVDPREVDSRAQGRQYLESLITGSQDPWFEPWRISPTENFRTRGHRDLAKGNGRRMHLLVNA